ncbi:hypothetical protein Tco_1331015 [Tanacetum coccineum]
MHERKKCFNGLGFLGLEEDLPRLLRCRDMFLPKEDHLEFSRLFSLPAGAELTFKAEELLLPIARAEDGSTPSNFFSGGRGVLQTDDSSVESYSVAEKAVTATEGSVVFLCDSARNILPVS